MQCLQAVKYIHIRAVKCTEVFRSEQTGVLKLQYNEGHVWMRSHSWNLFTGAPKTKSASLMEQWCSPGDPGIATFLPHFL